MQSFFRYSGAVHQTPQTRSQPDDLPENQYLPLIFSQRTMISGNFLF